MKNKQDIQDAVDKTMDSLDGLQRAMPRPFLFTRIKARLVREEKSFWSRALDFIGRPAVAMATVVIAVIINATVFFEFQSEPAQNAQDEEQVFASEYNLSTNTIYDASIDQ